MRGYVCLPAIVTNARKCGPGTRHGCDQGDGLDGYSWLEYDPREGGVQVIKDGLNNVKLTTEFLKVPGGKHGGSWAARIKGKPIDPGTWVIGILNCNVRSVTRDTSPSFAFISHFLHWPGGSWWDRHGD